MDKSEINGGKNSGVQVTLDEFEGDCVRKMDLGINPWRTIKE